MYVDKSSCNDLLRGFHSVCSYCYFKFLFYFDSDSHRTNITLSVLFYSRLFIFDVSRHVCGVRAYSPLIKLNTCYMKSVILKDVRNPTRNILRLNSFKLDVQKGNRKYCSLNIKSWGQRLWNCFYFCLQCRLLSQKTHKIFKTLALP